MYLTATKVLKEYYAWMKAIPDCCYHIWTAYNSAPTASHPPNHSQTSVDTSILFRIVPPDLQSRTSLPNMPISHPLQNLRQHQSVDMICRFWATPACYYLIALFFELFYLTFYLIWHANPLKVSAAFIICDVGTGCFLIAYGRSLYWYAQFPGKVVFYCIGQSLSAGFGFAVPISIGIFRAWEPWGYLLIAWAGTLLVNFVFDFLWVGLHWYRIPVSQFMIRSQ